MRPGLLPLRPWLLNFLSLLFPLTPFYSEFPGAKLEQGWSPDLRSLDGLMRASWKKWQWAGPGTVGGENELFRRRGPRLGIHSQLQFRSACPLLAVRPEVRSLILWVSFSSTQATEPPL